MEWAWGPAVGAVHCNHQNTQRQRATLFWDPPPPWGPARPPGGTQSGRLTLDPSLPAAVVKAPSWWCFLSTSGKRQVQKLMESF